MSLLQEIAYRRAIAQLSGRRPRRWKIPAPRLSSAPRLAYQSELTGRLATIDDLLHELILPELGAWRRAAGLERGVRLDAVADDITMTFSRFRVLYANAHPVTETEQTLAKVTEAADKSTAAAFRLQTQAALGIELISPTSGRAQLIERFIQENLDLVQTLDDQRFLQLTDVVRRGVSQGIRVESLRDEILHSLDVSKSKAAFLARDQTLKLQGQLTQQRQESAGIPGYTWSTSRDELVRPMHRALDKTLQLWSDPPVVAISKGVERHAHPGGDYSCRCVAVPRFEELLAALGV